MLTTVVEIQSKNAMHLSVQTSVSILVSLRSARSAAKEAHITSQNATQCAIPLPCLAPWYEHTDEALLFLFLLHHLWVLAISTYMTDARKLLCHLSGRVAKPRSQGVLTSYADHEAE